MGEVGSDHWKTWVHQRPATPMGQSGALTLFDAPKFEHQDYYRLLTAESKLDKFVPRVRCGDSLGASTAGQSLVRCALQRGVDWQFKVKDARKKLKSLCPTIKS
jgi:hypothetical protein